MSVRVLRPYFQGKGVVRVGLGRFSAYVSSFLAGQVDEPEVDQAVPEPESTLDPSIALPSSFRPSQRIPCMYISLAAGRVIAGQAFDKKACGGWEESPSHRSLQRQAPETIFGVWRLRLKGQRAWVTQGAGSRQQLPGVDA